MIGFLRLALALLIVVGAPALATHAVAATQPDERLADPVLEARARDIGRRLRCPVCQNTSIDESDATIAHDLRLLVRERLTAGDSDAQILQFMRQRYGDFILLDPPFNPTTWALWLAPVGGLAVLAVFVLVRARQARTPEPPPLTDEARATAARLLAGSGVQPGR